MEYANKSIMEYFDLVLSKKSSDLHINVGAPPKIRVDGELVAVGEELLDPETAKRFCYETINEHERAQFEAEWELDTAYNFEGKARFRVNLAMQQESVCGAFRIIPTQMPEARDLGLPEIVMKLTERPRGLILVTGPTGSGKSTTLAAMINTINMTRPEHIITVEDPVEFIHPSKKCVVMQREVGKDTKSFASALKRILRQDPDIVLVGEMRDLETIGAAITISETGHLVFGTLHTNTAVQTINRIIDVFPSSQQDQVRSQLSFILEGVFSQQLIRKKEGGRALAQEILIPTPAIRNLIREDKVHQIQSIMQMGQGKTGMQTMNQAVFNLVKQGVIDKDEALGYSTDPEEMKKMLGV